MEQSVYEKIRDSAKYLNIDIGDQEIASLALEKGLSDAELNAISGIFDYLKQRKQETIISTLLRLSRLPLKEPKTFDNFDFTQLRGKNVETLVELSNLSPLYAHRNIAFIGPQGVGKTHLAMAYGRECCLRGLKAYFLKATELNQKFTDARRVGRESAAINTLVKPSCLIIDEIGRCVFDKENTRMLFDVIDRRYNKEDPNTMIFTSNKGPDKWGEFFSEDDTLLCAMDRLFDAATVFMIKGVSYRGRKCNTVTLSAGEMINLQK